MVVEIWKVKIIVEIQTNKSTERKEFENVDIFDPENTLKEIEDYLWNFSTGVG